MATGRIGVTPTLGVRWSKAPAGGTTSLSGLDDNSVSLVYSVGYEQVYRNGVLLSRTNDYTATNGTSITLVDATIAGDIIEVFANELVPLTDAISKGQFNAKGALLSATAASTPGVLAVGSNDQVLTADSSTSTGLKWATPSSGGMTTLASGSLSNQDLSLTSISGSYNELILYLDVAKGSSGDYQVFLRFNANSSALYSQVRMSEVRGSYGAGDGEYKATSFVPHADAIETGEKAAIWLRIPEYANTTANKIFYWNSVTQDNQQNNPSSSAGSGIFQSTSAITGISSITNQLTGSYKLYGVK